MRNRNGTMSLYADMAGRLSGSPSPEVMGSLIALAKPIIRAAITAPPTDPIEPKTMTANAGSR